MNKIRYIVSLVALMMGASASAALISSESFSTPGAYLDATGIASDGNNVYTTTGNFGFTNTVRWVGNTALLKTVADSSLTHAGITGTALDGSVKFMGGLTSSGATSKTSRRPINSTITGSSFYLSGLVSSAGLLRAGEQYAMGFGEEQSIIDQNFLKGFHLGLSADAGGDSYLTAYAAGNVYTLGNALTAQQLSGTSQIVLKAELGAGTGDDTLTAWYALDGETGLTLAATWSNLTIVDSATDLNIFAVTTRSTITGYTGYADNTYIDEMRFGTTLQDVSSIPEPTTLGLLGVGMALTLLARRTRS